MITVCADQLFDVVPATNIDEQKSFSFGSLEKILPAILQIDDEVMKMLKRKDAQ